jgi:hypothetical protein
MHAVTELPSGSNVAQKHRRSMIIQSLMWKVFGVIPAKAGIQFFYPLLDPRLSPG